MQKSKKKRRKKSSDDEEKPKKKKHKKSDSSDDTTDSQVFGRPLPLENSGNQITADAVKMPGALFSQAAHLAAQQTCTRGRGDADTAAWAASGDQWGAYLKTILQPQYSHQIPAEVLRELKTLAASLECLSKGEVAELGDLLAQRFKSIELSLSGNDSAAAAVQLISMREGGLTSHRELEQAQSFQKKQLKLMEQQRALG